MQAQIDALQQQVTALQQQLTELASAVAATKTEAAQATEVATLIADQVESVGAPQQSATSIGGYGELHYNNLDSGKEIDFHRFVLYFDHQFTERLSLVTELEIEHALAGDGKPGEVELEQAYIQYDLGGNAAAKAGLFLVPVGILNETHEPPTFYGVERNEIEKNIIPTTWWEAGAAYSGYNDSGWSWDVALHSGLNTPIDGSNAYKIRSGRQKVAEARADDPALTGRLKYTGIPGLELAMSAQYQSDLTQGLATESASATLLEAHLNYQRGAFGLTALAAQWDIDSSAAELLGRDQQQGYFLQPSWRINDEWGLFARYSEWNNEAGLPGEDAKQFDIGVNWWLHEDVVLKADYENQSGSEDDKGFNLGVGYQF
ncbi:MAG: porin [Gammaproteobacteria bacterium]|nr:porin [Gammaproteobacteria bacterium]